MKLGEFFLCLACVAAVSIAAVVFCQRRGCILYYGDAAAHINIARRVVDSRTPGYAQLGTVWLPLPHALMLPLVRHDSLWRSGLAGAIPAAVFFIAAAMFLYAAVRRSTGSLAAATAAAALFALNPNLLYLQSTPMTEPVFLGCFAAAVYFCVRFQQSPRLTCVLASAFFVLLASLSRYEGWFLIPFFAVFFLLAGSLRAAVVFTAIATLGPLYWLAHNFYYFKDPLEFYRGPYSAQAIYAHALAQGFARYPGDHDWRSSCLYYWRAMELVMGKPVAWAGAAGIAAALLRRRTRVLALLVLPVPFYILSLHSGGTPVFVPALYPFSYYNTRYALAALPACAAGAGVLVALWPYSALRATALALILAAGLGGWALRPRLANVACWKESEVNSRGRREWTSQAAAFFREHYKTGDGILTASGDVMAVYQSAGIPLRETLHDGNWPQWQMVTARPDLLLRERWVVALAGDAVSFQLSNPGRSGSLCERAAVFSAPREPVVDIYEKVLRLRPPEIERAKLLP